MRRDDKDIEKSVFFSLVRGFAFGPAIVSAKLKENNIIGSHTPVHNRSSMTRPICEKGFLLLEWAEWGDNGWWQLLMYYCSGRMLLDSPESECENMKTTLQQKLELSVGFFMTEATTATDDDVLLLAFACLFVGF